MKLKQIEEIATHKVPVWQPALLVVLLILGFTVVPYIANQAKLQKKKEVPKTLGATLGIATLRNKVEKGTVSFVKPYVATLQKGVESVLGIAQQKAVDIATNSAQQAKEYVVDSAAAKLLDTVNTLPKDQQELIKNAICK